MPKILLNSFNWLLFLMTSIFLTLGVFLSLGMLTSGFSASLSVQSANFQSLFLLGFLPAMLAGLLFYRFSLQFSRKHLWVGAIVSLLFLLFTYDISYFIFKIFGLTDETYKSQFNPLFALITLAGFLGGLFIGYKFSNNQQSRFFSWGMIVLANLALMAFMFMFISLFYLTFSSQHTTWQFISMRLSQISLPLVITTLTCIWMNYQIAPRGYQFKVTLGAILFFHGLLFIIRLLNNVYPQWDAYFNQENLIDQGFTLLGIFVGIGIGLLMRKQSNSSSQIAL